jgi:hypothetical protein
MRQQTTVRLCGTARDAFHEQFAVNQPEDAEAWLWHSQLLPGSLDIGTMGGWGA